MKTTYFNKFFWPTITGLASVLISFTRMFLGEKDFLVNNIWAEDGLLVVCYLKSNIFSCLTDSYSGYLLLYPRIISFIVHYFSVENWALVNNLLYFIVIFLISFLVYSMWIQSLNAWEFKVLGYRLSTLIIVNILPFFIIKNREYLEKRNTHFSSLICFDPP